MRAIEYIKIQVVKSYNTKPSHYECYDTDVWNDVVPYDVIFHKSHIIQISKKSARRTKIFIDIFYPHRHRDYFIINLSLDRVLNVLNGNESWQNPNYVFTEVERVYETRIDCLIAPEGVRQNKLVA